MILGNGSRADCIKSLILTQCGSRCPLFHAKGIEYRTQNKALIMKLALQVYFFQCQISQNKIKIISLIMKSCLSRNISSLDFTLLKYNRGKTATVMYVIAFNARLFPTKITCRKFKRKYEKRHGTMHYENMLRIMNMHESKV